jgi:hypothetical protein
MVKLPPRHPTHTLGDQPIQQEYREQMNKLARALDIYFNGEARGHDRQTGFVLLVYPFSEMDGTDKPGTQPRCNFISNGADRKDIVSLFKEMIARFEGQPEITGHG